MPQTKTTHSLPRRRADQYNDPGYNYQQYWEGREYEHAAEELAIKRLLKGKHFKVAADVGGGYGRLCLLLEKYADKVVLAEPSSQQLDLAKHFLQGHPEIERRLMQADDLQFADGSIDLITLVRVLHHLPDPEAELREIARALTPDGCAVIEVANYAHMRNRLKHLIRGKRMPVKPVDIRSAEHRGKDEVPFVNHNPKTLMRQLEHAGLRVERTLSVSNLRSSSLKEHVPLRTMLIVENLLQTPLSYLYFGPSIFFLVRKNTK